MPPKKARIPEAVYVPYQRAEHHLKRFGGNYQSVTRLLHDSYEDEQVDAVVALLISRGVLKATPEDLMSYACWYLGQRSSSISTIREKLSRKAVSVKDVDVVVERLIDMRYLNDEEFADARIRSRKLTGYGPERVRRDLSNKGIDKAITETQLECVDGDEWIQLGIDLVLRRYSGLPADNVARNKRFRWLVNRGYGFDIAKRILQAVDQTYAE